MDHIATLVGQLRGPTVLGRVAAAQALGRLGREAAPALRHLLDRYLQTDDPAEHDAVAHALSRLGPELLRSARFVRTALVDRFPKRPRLRRRLGLVLELILMDRPGVVDQLIPLLRAGDVEVVQQAAEALGCARVDGPPARAVAESLLRLFDRPDRDQLEWDTPAVQLVALGQGPGGQEVVEAVLARLRVAPAWASSSHLYHLLESLAREAPAGPGGEGLLRLMEGEEGALIRVGALRAGGTLDGEGITRACCQALGDPDAEVRSAAAAAMTCWSPRRLEGIWKQLLPALEDSGPLVAEAAAYSLGMVGPAAQDALPALRARLQEARAVLDGLLAGAGPGREAAEPEQVRRARLSVSRFQQSIEQIEPPRAS
jgi:HEAT repeat protein